MRRILWIALLATSAAAAPVVIERRLHVRIPMRDGTQTCAHVFRPAMPARGPALLVRTPYGKGPDITPQWQAFVEHGYALVIQDVRGRYDSHGSFGTLDQETRDGDDTIKWITRQPWSDGGVGMFGGSYLGILQWRAALSQNPSLRAIFPYVSGFDEYLDRFYSRGGALKLGHRLHWISQNLRGTNYRPPEFVRYVSYLPIRDADRLAAGQKVDIYQRALDHPEYDDYWKASSTRRRLARLRTPVFSVTGWYDNYSQSDLEAFSELAGRVDRRLMVGPWPHNIGAGFSTMDYGPEARVALRKHQFEWFDHWLKGAPPPAGAPLRLFVMGANRWRDEFEWPLARTRYTPFYFTSERGANTLDGDGLLNTRPSAREGKDEFTYDPRNPVPTVGGAVCCDPKVFPWGPMDQRPVERRRDVLVYTSAPLRQPVEVTGPIRVKLYVSTSAYDTDFTAKLVDVYPDGRAINLTDGILRLRYRTSLEQAILTNPGELLLIDIDAGVTSNVFLTDHRIRVEISSSNFPRFDRNPNTGGRIADEKNLVPAKQTIHHSQRYPSHILLPVIPE